MAFVLAGAIAIGAAVMSRFQINGAISKNSPNAMRRARWTLPIGAGLAVIVAASHWAGLSW